MKHTRQRQEVRPDIYEITNEIENDAFAYKQLIKYRKTIDANDRQWKWVNERIKEEDEYLRQSRITLMDLIDDGMSYDENLVLCNSVRRLSAVLRNNKKVT